MTTRTTAATRQGRMMLAELLVSGVTTSGKNRESDEGKVNAIACVWVCVAEKKDSLSSVLGLRCT